MSADDPLMARREARVIELRTASFRARATDACTHVRKAMEILEPAAQDPDLQQAFDLLDQLATILIAKLETRPR